MQQLELARSGRLPLTTDAVVNDLVLRLGQRNRLAAQRRAAYVRLARHILDEAAPAVFPGCGREGDADRLMAA